MRIPMLPKAADTKPLIDCMRFAAEETGVTESTAALVMSAFLQELAAQVCKGRIVRIPGFGVFGCAIKRGKRACAQNGGRPVPHPKFSPSHGFRQECRYTAPVNEKTHKQIEKHQDNHALSRKGHAHERVFTAQEGFRDQIRLQMEDME